MKRTRSQRQFFTLLSMLVVLGISATGVQDAQARRRRRHKKKQVPAVFSSFRPIHVDKSKLETVTFGRMAIGAALPGAGELSGPQFRINILRRLEKAGYPVAGIGTTLFGEATKDEKARYVLAGTFNEIACEEVLRDGKWRRCRVGVKWELFDRKRKEVVYRVQTRAVAMDSDLALERLGKKLIELNTDSLLSRRRFVHALEKRDSSPKEDKVPAASFEQAHFRTCAAPELKLPDETDKALNAVVVVKHGETLGSGVFVSPDGFVVTAAHVVEGTDKATVQSRQGKKLPAVVLRVDPKNDVALLHVESEEESPCLQPRTEEPVKVGEKVLVAGSPVGQELSFSVTAGIVSGFRTLNGAEWIQTDASVSPGYSGGPLLDQKGRWMGLVSWKVVGGGVEGVAFGVPSSQVFRGLAISPGGTTSAALYRPVEGTKPSSSKQTHQPVDDKPDPVPELDPTKAMRRSAAANLVFGTGAMATILGGVFVFILSAGERDGLDLDMELNVAKASVVGGLGAMFVGYVLMPKVPVYPHGFVFEDKKSNRPVRGAGAQTTARSRPSFSITPAIGPGSLGVVGTF